MRLNKFLLICSLLIVFAVFIQSCSKSSEGDAPILTTVNIIDRNGLTETISAPERLKQYQKVDFCQPQPYQKVLRIYSRDSAGNLPSYLTSYHPNGQVKQYLEILNSRAFGRYMEWHENGVLKLDAYVIGGEADLAPTAVRTWLFDAQNQAWDENGCLLADIFYAKGALEGPSRYYFPNGAVWKVIPFSNNAIHGTMQVFLPDGQLYQSINFNNGNKEGDAVQYWAGNILAAQESYQKGLLSTGTYYNKAGEIVAQIEKGNGMRAVFNKETLKELQEYRNGKLEGEVKVFDVQGFLSKIYHIKNDIKHGEEIQYMPPPPFQNPDQYRPMPKLLLNWYENKIQGNVKTWYANGQLESQREMSNNVKNGMLTAWYVDGSIMMIEEYDHDKLMKGSYFKRQEKEAVSQVIKGKGTATIFDSEGNFLRRIAYNQGKVVE